jgi:hypothetical protein
LYTKVFIDKMVKVNPGTKNLIPVPRSDNTTEPLADAQLQVRVFRDIDALVRSLPNKSAWLRRVITEAAQRELMGGNES